MACLLAPSACAAIWGFAEGTAGTTGSGGAGGLGGAAAQGGATGANGGAGGAAVVCLCPSCEWDEFGAPTRLDSLSSDAGDLDPSPSFDGRTLYFGSGRDAPSGSVNWNLWVASRANADASFEAPTELAEQNSDAGEYGVDLAPDGLTLYYASNRFSDAGGYDLLRATRSELDAGFGAPVPIDELNAEGDDLDPHLATDGLTLYFASDRDGSGERDLWIARRDAGDAPFGAPTRLPILSSALPEYDPALSADGLELFFTRNDDPGLRDLWVARRSHPGEPFEDAAPVIVLNTNANELSPALSADGTTLYFASDRGRDLDDWDLYQAQRECL